MRRIYEAPKKTKAVRTLLGKAAKSESFCHLVVAMRELMVEHCASAGHMRKALALAIHEQAWSSYRIQQGMQEEIVEEEIDEGPTGFFSEDDEEEAV